MTKRVALVTGGTSGIGEAVVRKMCEQDIDVVYTGSNTEAAERISASTGAQFVKHDVRDEDGWQQVVATVRKKGRLDIVFANAGVNSGDADIENISVSDWRNVLDINCTGAMLTCKNAIAVMKDNPKDVTGSIIVNSSVVGLFGLPDDVAYTTSKGAVGSLTKSVAVYCARQQYNIRCNSIHPGIVETPNILNAMQESGDVEAARQFLESASPLRRLGKAEEIADLVLYLASDSSSFITGAQIVIDGGATAGFSGV
jgi:NAD(P)-dependent dehydrogenase (short-subunit alcohol dehydrogenase family)